MLIPKLRGGYKAQPIGIFPDNKPIREPFNRILTERRDICRDFDFGLKTIRKNGTYERIVEKYENMTELQASGEFEDNSRG